MIQNISFFFFSFLILTSAFAIFHTKNAVYSVLFLILTFVNASILLFISHVEFLSLLLIIIYIGAIAILFLFIIMMLDISSAKKEKIYYFLPIIIILTVLFLSQISFFFFNSIFSYNFTFSNVNFSLLMSTYVSGDMGFEKYNHTYYHSTINNGGYYEKLLLLDKTANTETLGQILYSNYVLLLLLAGLILLIALISSVVLTLNVKTGAFSQKQYKQISREPEFSILNFNQK